MNILTTSDLSQKLELFGEQVCQADPVNFDDFTIKDIEHAYVLKISSSRKCMGFQVAKNMESRLKTQGFDVSDISICLGYGSYICLSATIKKD